MAVAGADRLALTDEIAVMDLIALGDALLSPEDDLSLAAVLRSPLFGVSEEALFERLRHVEGSARVERFAPGEASRTVYVPITNDAFAEPTKSFTVLLGRGGASAGACGSSKATWGMHWARARSLSLVLKTITSSGSMLENHIQRCAG